jgi:hypothetical protein
VTKVEPAVQRPHAQHNLGLPNIADLTTAVALLLDQLTRSAGRIPELIIMTEDFHAFSKNLSANPSTGMLSITPRNLLSLTIQRSYLADCIFHSRFSKKLFAQRQGYILGKCTLQHTGFQFLSYRSRRPPCRYLLATEGN